MLRVSSPYYAMQMPQQQQRFIIILVLIICKLWLLKWKLLYAAQKMPVEKLKANREIWGMFWGCLSTRIQKRLKTTIF